MKTKFLSLMSLTAILLFAASCQKEENKVYFDKASSPTLTASTAAVVLTPGKEADNAITFNWTNPNYYFTTGISSQNVNYRLEMDTTGGNFASGAKYSTSVTSDLTRSFNVGILNSIFGNDMRLTRGRVANLEARITSTLASNALPQYSNVIKFTATPFAPPPKVALPTSGRLFLVGDASPGGWPNPVPANQEFTKVPNTNNTRYEITINLNADKTVLMLPVNGSWDDKYGWDGPNNANNTGGDKLKRGGGDIKVPGATGLYKITADFQDGVFTIVKQ